MLQHYNKGAMMYSAIMVIGTLYGRGIYNDTRGGAGDSLAPPQFFYTHTLERRRRAQTGWPATSIRGADMRSPNPDAGAQKLGRRGADI